jgi:hypothetical protein
MGAGACWGIRVSPGSREFKSPLGHEPLAYTLGGHLSDQDFLFVRMVGQPQS